jgi:DNA-binding transcriptional MerR regulator
VSKKKLMPIGTAAKKAGISRQSLQYYLMVGLLEPTEVTPTGRRMFDEKCHKGIISGRPD